MSKPNLLKLIKSLSILSLFIIFTPIAKGEPMTQFSEPKEPMAFVEGKTYTAAIKTDKGDILCELNHKEAPLGVTNFVQLARGGFYKGLTFHRVEPGFVIQGGDPSGNGTGGPGYTVKGETKNGLKHTKGALAFARLPDSVNPEQRSSGSQFYITLAPTAFLDNNYTVFGYVTQGADVTEKISKGDKILDVVISEN